MNFFIRLFKGINLSGNTTIRITVYARHVDNLSLSSSANLTATRPVSLKLAGSIAGSGDATLWARKSLAVSIAG